MLNVTGVCRVTGIKEFQNAVIGNLYTSTNDKKGNWVTGFIPCYFVKDAIEKYVEFNIQNKDKINITKSFMKSESYNNKITLKVVILDFEKAEEQEQKENSTLRDRYNKSKK